MNTVKAKGNKYKRLSLLIIVITVSLLYIICIYRLSPEASTENISPFTTTVAETASGYFVNSTESTVPISEVRENSLLTTADSDLPRDVSISAPYAGLYKASTGEALFEKNAEAQIHPASLTKILTAKTALAHMDSQTVITVGTELNLLPKRSSLCLIKQGHKLTLYDLLTGMLVSSGNDAAYTVAVSTARFVSKKDDLADKEALTYFTELMNTEAKSMGALNSHFSTPDGFDSAEQYTTVRDLFIICNSALSSSEICQITSTVKKKVIFESGENVTWSNSNELLHPDSPYYFTKASGMKTGTTPLAGKCLIAVAEINGDTYIAIVAGCESDDERYTSAVKLFESVYSK